MEKLELRFCFTLFVYTMFLISTITAQGKSYFFPSKFHWRHAPRFFKYPNLAPNSNVRCVAHQSRHICHTISRLRGGIEYIDTPVNTTLEYTTNHYNRVYVAVGANIGDRFQNLMSAISKLNETKSKDSANRLIVVTKTSFLRETAPMYVTDQPSFLNGAIEIETMLSPHALLRRLKEIESDIGRDFYNGIRYGPRPIDLDIIFYSNGRDDAGGIVLESPSLQIPHPRMHERKFVLAPLCDINQEIVHPLMNISTKEMLSNIHHSQCDHTSDNKEPSVVKVLPLPRNRMLTLNKIHIMGILNLTPDSFSDGGRYDGSVDLAVQQALKLIEDGATIVDIGGESTRPGAKEIALEIELNRTLPVIQRIRQISDDIIISIDTRNSAVAKAAVEAGADIVNDVSGGTHDPEMFRVVAQLKVPIVIMHMRGTPENMQTMTQYEDVVAEVSASLSKQSMLAEAAGIPRWLQVLDPGIGFAKDLNGNLSLLKHTNEIRDQVNNFPLLIGPSRKGFIGKLTNESIADERDFGTLSSCLVSVLQSNNTIVPTILRVHNVKGIKQGVTVFEAILNAK